MIYQNCIIGLDYKNNKLVVASIYHNALIIFNDTKQSFSPFAALNGAGNKQDGTSFDGVSKWKLVKSS